MAKSNLTKKSVGAEAATKNDGTDSYSLQIFSSFEEENESTAAMNAARSPEENFKMALEIIRMMYKTDLENSEPTHNRITFTVIDGLPVE